MNNQFNRSAKLIGEVGIENLGKAKVILFGVGGVGSYILEALCRGGVGQITVVDKDVVDETNINRQLIALHSNIGKSKVETAKNRCLDINPNLQIKTFEICVSPQNISDFALETYDYVVDAVDMVTAKLAIIEEAHQKGVPVMASMGTGNKMHPERFEIADIKKTSVCPLAKVMRRELKARGINKLKVVYSKEEPLARLTPPGSMSFVPPVAGLLIAGEVIKDLLKLSKID